MVLNGTVSHISLWGVLNLKKEAHFACHFVERIRDYLLSGSQVNLVLGKLMNGENYVTQSL